MRRNAQIISQHPINPYQISTLLSVLVLTALSSSAWSIPRSATPTTPESLSGAWIGHYECEGKRHPVLLQTSEGYRGKLRALFHGLYESADYLSFTLTGEVREQRRVKITLTPEAWIENPDDRFHSVGLRGTVDGSSIRGQVEHASCGEVRLRRLECDLTPSSPCTRNARGEFARFLKRDGSRRPARPVPPPPNRPEVLVKKPLSQSAFRAHKKAFKMFSFDEKRIKYLETLPADVHLTVAQVRVLLDAFSFDPKRLTALKLLTPRLVDHSESFTLLGTFTFGKQRAAGREVLSDAAHAEHERVERERERLREYRRKLREHRKRFKRRGERNESGERDDKAPNNARAPLPRALTSRTFKVLMKQLEAESFDKGKLNVLTLVCEMGYFSSKQARKLLKLWSFDQDRLEALKVIAPRLIELNQRAEIIQAFSFESHRTQALKILTRRARR